MASRVQEHPDETALLHSIITSETAWGLSVGVASNLIVAAILQFGPWDNVSAGTWLIVLGTWNELLGVLLVASPEILPRAEKFARRALGWLERQRLRLVRVLKRLLGRPERTWTSGPSGGIEFGGSADTKYMPGEPLGDHEEKIAWLIERVRLHESRLHDIDWAVAKMPISGEPKWMPFARNSKASSEN